MTYQANDRPWQPRWESIRSHLPEGGVALDLGANDGCFSEQLAAMGFTVHAIERKGEPQRIDGVHWHKATISAEYVKTLAEQVGPFDVVLAMSIIHHLRDWASAYWAIRAVSKVAIFEVPNPLEERTRSRTLDAKVGPLYELVMAGGAVIGEAPGWKTRHLRPTVLHCGKAVPSGIRGVVTDGKRIASGRTPMLDARQQIGYQPFPGTLNVRLAEPLVPDFAPVVLSIGQRKYQTWPARVNGVPCHIYRPPNAKRWDRIELLARVALRPALGLKTGDPVVVEVSHDA